ncbi:hypothetical protein CW304_11955 [Bacillus sp. UFRGS-B20]|nr:hypothetical protein CW304_11955 [Bacillus sp. UFRGS-B20]
MCCYHVLPPSRNAHFCSLRLVRFPDLLLLTPLTTLFNRERFVYGRDMYCCGYLRLCWIFFLIMLSASCLKLIYVTPHSCSYELFQQISLMIPHLIGLRNRFYIMMETFF